MKILFSFFLLSLACHYSLAQKTQCRSYYGIHADISAGDKIRSLLAELGDPAELFSNYEGRVDHISAELGLSKDFVKAELVKVIKQQAWTEPKAGLKVRVVLELPDEMKGVMYWLAPGFKTPAHKHGGDELTVVIEGTFESDGVVYSAGQTIRREEGSIDPPGNAGPEGALLFVFRVRPIQPVPALNP